MRRRRCIRRPFDQRFIAALARRARIRIGQKHNRRFETLGTVHGQQLHDTNARGGAALGNPFVRGFLIGAAARAFEFINEARQTGKAAVVHLQRQRDEGIQISRDAGGEMRGRGGGVARVEIRLVIHPVEQIMHRQGIGQGQPARQQITRACQRRRQRGGIR